MFKNYLICAYKVLMRRKMFTFISLFAISLTLAILLVVSTVADNYIYPMGPEKRGQNFLVINNLDISTESGNASSSSGLGYRFYQDNITRLKTPEKIALYDDAQRVSSYQQAGRIELSLRLTDLNYWQILDFDFVKGRPFDQHSFDTGAMQAVINQSTATTFFDNQDPIGKKIGVNRQTFTVIGVVKDVSSLEMEAHSDMWALYTTQPSTEYQADLLGSWSALLYHSDSAKLPQIKKQYQQLLENDVVLVNTSGFTVAKSTIDTRIEKIIRDITGDYSQNSNFNKVGLYTFLTILGFMLLPAINLINLNVSRVMERASEIGVRKSFGASSNQLAIQFLVENLVITLIGGIIGFALSIGILSIIESSSFIPDVQFGLRANTLIYGIALVVVFGLLSGVYPAWKMSKLHPVSALKGSF